MRGQTWLDYTVKTQSNGSDEGDNALNLNRENMKKIMALITFAILLYVGLQNTRLVASALRSAARLIAPFLIGGCIAFVLNVPMRFF